MSRAYCPKHDRKHFPKEWQEIEISYLTVLSFFSESLELELEKLERVNGVSHYLYW